MVGRVNVYLRLILQIKLELEKIPISFIVLLTY